jgi:hypothetical protein
MRFAIDHSETLEVFLLLPTDGISGHLYGSQSDICEIATAQEREHIRDSPKMNVWCGVMHGQVIGPFFFKSTRST